MIILGIDPGASGAIVAIGSAGMEVTAMPATEGDVVNLLRKYSEPPWLASHTFEKVAFLEGLVKHMGAGIPASTMAVYASNWGIILGALMMANWRVRIVRPQDWQKALGLGITGRQKANVKGLSPGAAKAEKARVRLLNGQLKRDWKNKLKSRAQQLFPGVTVTLGNADALLIAEFGSTALKSDAGKDSRGR
jgi:hypothetical protein